MRGPLEKFVAISSDGPTLDGIFLDAADATRGGAVVAAPHPLYGGSMDHPVVGELAYACSTVGLASLRFNWRGVGASEGEPSGDAGDADADYQATLVHLVESVTGPVAACGYSFGAATALRAATHPRVEHLVLVAPPPGLLDTAALAGFGGSILVLVGEHDALAPVREVQEALGPETRVEVIPDADHFFGVGLGVIRRSVVAALGS